VGVTLYKVLNADGESMHGGKLKWSLPRDGKPGDWHEEPRVALCSKGLHLTDSPTRWGAESGRVFEVEAEGVSGSCDQAEDRKVVAKKVRLLREVTAADVAGAISPDAHLSSGLEWWWLGDGYGDGSGYGSGYGDGSGYGYGSGYGDGSGDGYGDGSGYGSGSSPS